MATYTISDLQRFEGILNRGQMQRNDAMRCAQLVSSLRTAANNSAQCRTLDHQVRSKLQQLIARFGNARFAPDAPVIPAAEGAPTTGR